MRDAFPGENLRWQDVARALPQAVWLVDVASLRIVYANPAAQQLVGRSAAALVGRPVRELMPEPQDEIFWSRPLSEVAAGIHSHTSVLDVRTGQLIPVERTVRALEAGPSSGEGPGCPWLLVTLRDRREQEAGERELELLLAELRATLDCAADAILSCDLQGRVRAFNRRFAQLWELPERLLQGRDDAAVMAHLRAQVKVPGDYGARMAALLADPASEGCEVLQLRSGLTVEQRSVPQRVRGRTAGRIYVFRDITQHVHDQAGLRLAAQVFESSLDAIAIADAQGRIVRANPAAEQLTGLPHALLVGREVGGLLDLGEEQAGLRSEVEQAWAQQDFWAGEVSLCPDGGGPGVPVHLSWVAVRDERGAIVQSIAFMRDLGPHRAAQRRIEELAFSDALTGLPNRLRLGDRVRAAIAGAAVGGEEFALLFLDLDRFKIVNDSLGHPFGDRVLKLVAQRLQGCLRQCDMLCRLGGDEFVVYLDGAGAGVAEAVAQRILEDMDRPFHLEGLGFSVQASIGIALYPHDACNLDDLIKHADAAMYRVKERGRGSYGFYQPRMNADLLERMKLEHAMRHALERGHMQVHYQPQVAMASGAIVGAEALLRWTDPQLGPVAPARFIPLAEESGYIVTLGAWVLAQAVAEAARLRAAGTPLVVSVNVSALEFRQAGFVGRIAGLLAQHALPARWLQLELTESVLLQDAEEMRQVLAALAELGIGLAIDDFGTGYSSLAYLRDLRIERLKIDKSFVDGLPQNEGSRAIVQAILSMGAALGIQVVAEGVETAQQRELLAALGCTHYQGFFCAPALPAPELQALAAGVGGKRGRGGEVSADATGPAT